MAPDETASGQHITTSPEAPSAATTDRSCLWVEDERAKQRRGVRVSDPETMRCRHDGEVFCKPCLTRFALPTQPSRPSVSTTSPDTPTPPTTASRDTAQAVRDGR